MVVYDNKRFWKRGRRSNGAPHAGGAYIALESEVALAGDPAVPVAYTPFLLKKT